MTQSQIYLFLNYKRKVTGCHKMKTCYELYFLINEKMLMEISLSDLESKRVKFIKIHLKFLQAVFKGTNLLLIGKNESAWKVPKL